MTVFKLAVAILITICSNALAQTSFWNSSAKPGLPEVSNSAAVTLGLKFYSDVPGSVTGVRFYKGSRNTGLHTGNLWSNTGVKLATVTFSSETASGWQQANFSSPIKIAANTTYVISYSAPEGRHAHDQYFPWLNLTASPLHVKGSTPGVYIYGSGAQFPKMTWNNSNYWVDVVFSPAGATSTYSISGVVTKAGVNMTLSGAASGSTVTDSVGAFSFTGLPNGSYVVTPQQSGYVFTPANASVTINGGSMTTVPFLASAISSIWTNSTTPGLSEVTSTASVTLGLKFYSDVPGSVIGVRFYKGPNNSGIHVGNLWSSTGVKLGTVTFSGETASGWQQANFSSPIVIEPNTTYVISYLAPVGRHAHDQNFPWSAVTGGPLHVSDASPGVYTYGSGALFPNMAWNSSNYWVDLVFNPANGSNPSNPTPPPAPTPVPTTYSISGTVTGSGATVTLSGAAARSTPTNSLGDYSFADLSNGAYIVAVSQPGYTFAPTTASVSINGNSISGINFIGSAIPVPLPHSVLLSWSASTTPNVIGYNVYRADTAGGAYLKINTTPLTTTTHNDSTVTAGRVYYYVATALDSNQNESTYSSQATAVIPTP